VATTATLWAVRISSRPADREHSYGHGKIENLSALFQTVLLLLTCFWIFGEAVDRLFFAESVHVKPSVWAFLVVLASIAIDGWRSRALKRAADKYSSQALEADALHFSTDIWSSLVVLIGLCGVLISERFDMPWLMGADAAAALVVAAIVVYVSLRLGKKSVDDLLDSVPGALRDEVVEIVRQVAGVEDITRLRLRRSGPEVFADVTLAIERAASLERSHDITRDVEESLQKILPGADVVVHVEPVAAGEEDVTTVVRLIAARLGLGAHGVRIYEENRRRWLELHLEVRDSLLLDEAHRQATEFERALRKSLPGISRIVTHIEPAGDAAALVRGEPADQERVQQAIAEFLHGYPLHVNPHDVRVQRTGDELAVSLHCTLDPATPITDAHELTVRLEEHLRARVPSLGRVVIHPEPFRS